MSKHRIVRCGVAVLCAALVVTGCTVDNEWIYTGTLEAQEYTVSSEVGGELLSIQVENGDQVLKGDVLAEVDATGLQLELKRLEANASTIEAQLTLVVKGARSEELNQIEIQIRQQEEAVSAQADRYAFALDQYQDLYQLNQQGAVSDQQLKEAALARDNAADLLDQAREQKNVLLEKRNLLVSGARSEEIDALQSQLEAARWAVESVKLKIGKTQMVAAVDGTVEWVQYNTGEIYRPLTPFATILEEDSLTVKIFVEERNLHKVNLGDQLDVIAPHMEDPIKGTVVYVATQGEFTPKNTESRENRQVVVYEIQLELDSSNLQLKPGMMVDVHLNGVDS